MKATPALPAIYPHTGMTVIELLIATTILAIVLVIALPNLSVFKFETRRSHYISTLDRHLNAARAYAIYHNQTVTVCPHLALECTDSWRNDILIFVDDDNNRQRGASEKILGTVTKPIAEDWVRYNRISLAFGPTGMLTGLSNGTFIYCSQKPELNEPAVRITISYVGRTRVRDVSQACN